MSKKFIALVIGLIALIGGVVVVQSQNIGTSALWNLSNQGTWLLPLVIFSSLIDSINPCSFSVLLLTIAFLLSIGSLRTNIFKIGGVYIAGIFAAYFLIGIGILQALHLFNTPHFMGRLGAALLVLLGVINILTHYFPNFPIQLRIPGLAHRSIAGLMEKASVPAAFLLGVVVGLCEFPCTGGPYLMILGLLHDRVTYFTGIGYLVLYNLLFISPLVLILGIASDRTMLAKVEKWHQGEKKSARLWEGLIMIILGLLISYL